jgi:Ca2+-binding EF-hand superfamily protein
MINFDSVTPSPAMSRSKRSLSFGVAEEHEANAHLLFMKFNKDGDKFLDRHEFVKGLESLGDLIDLSSHEAGRLYDKLDVHGEGLVDIDEFQKVYSCTFLRNNV